MERIAMILTNKIRTANPNFTDLQIRTICFGLECLLSELTKFIIYSAIFASLGVIQYYFIALVFFCILRGFIGGFHNEKYWQCMITTFLIFLLTVLIGKFVIIAFTIKVVLLILSVIAIVIYAPVDHPNKPIINDKRRMTLKYLSVGIFFILGIIALFLQEPYSTTATTALVFAVILLPVGFFIKKGTCPVT